MSNVTQERQELHNNIWKLANELRGSVDGWDFKSYVLGFLFYRYISENLVKSINETERNAGNENFDYLTFDDTLAEGAKSRIVNVKGFFILPSMLFQNVVNNCETNENLNVDLSNIFRYIETSATGTPSENDIKGLFSDIDLTSNKLGATVVQRNTKLVKILQGINNINLNEDYDGNSIDAFGDAYEYLMGMYASNAGKSGGEYYTPQEVSELLAKITSYQRDDILSVYDPTCGSGSLLLKFAKARPDLVENIKFYGQEINISTFNLCRINMFLHNISYNNFNIMLGDTLMEPQHLDKKFDAIVSNPPYSISYLGDGSPALVTDERFTGPGVLAPKSKADLAFVLHALHQLNENGTAAIVCFPGVFYRNGAEQKIRKWLVENNYVDAIIGLPENIFYGTSIATTVIVLKKNKTNRDVLFIDASKEFVPVKNNNLLDENNINNIMEYFTTRENKEGISKVVSNELIGEQNFSLNVNDYVENLDDNEEVNIVELNSLIDDTVVKLLELRENISECISEIEVE